MASSSVRLKTSSLSVRDTLHNLLYVTVLCFSTAVRTRLRRKMQQSPCQPSWWRLNYLQQAEWRLFSGKICIGVAYSDAHLQLDKKQAKLGPKSSAEESEILVLAHTRFDNERAWYNTPSMRSALAN